MSAVIETVTAWPVIIQGALGSALFAFCFYLGQVAVKLISKKSKTYSKQVSDEIVARDELLKETLAEGDLNDKLLVLSGMTYPALHYVIKALMFFAFGHLAESIIPVFGSIGILIGVFFLFKALLYCPSLTKFEQESSKSEN
ncbi:hypothetical protein P3384_23100 [Vibrio parahaemolyticus]|nr:hypothetical protein [Vibrio parahaemolyticus]MDF4466850.1 hypothetical protein [Vibrio parahaemolyticus]MDF4471576.1 hypothetical protein [Vibrio parahaemolyticus]MDF4494917.1 hypothetical protein [Vibrio parahaemolyticus]MDG2570377.1 hypothetical protein [Vibrio parahaemolyticus]